MATVADWLKIDADTVVRSLKDASEKVNSSEGELILDFSLVRRIDAAAIPALEKLAETAAQKNVKLVLRGVNVDIYKVLKLVKLAPCFSFLP